MGKKKSENSIIEPTPTFLEREKYPVYIQEWGLITRPKAGRCGQCGGNFNKGNVAGALFNTTHTGYEIETRCLTCLQHFNPNAENKKNYEVTQRKTKCTTCAKTIEKHNMRATYMVARQLKNNIINKKVYMCMECEAIRLLRYHKLKRTVKSKYKEQLHNTIHRRNIEGCFNTPLAHEMEACQEHHHTAQYSIRYASKDDYTVTVHSPWGYRTGGGELKYTKKERERILEAIKNELPTIEKEHQEQKTRGNRYGN